jgi:hypothetical protein
VGLVRDLAAYRWSSSPVHGLGWTEDLLRGVPGWSRLGPTEEARRAFWCGWVHEPLTERELAAVRKAVTAGRPYGSALWEKATAGRVGIDLAARPRKQGIKCIK